MMGPVNHIPAHLQVLNQGARASTSLILLIYSLLSGFVAHRTVVMGESDRDVDSVVDGLDNLALAFPEVTVIVGDEERTFMCERELLSRGCGYFKVGLFVLS